VQHSRHRQARSRDDLTGIYRGAVPACGMEPGDDAVNICSGFWNWYNQRRVWELAPPPGPTNEPVDTEYRTRAYILLHEVMHSLYGCKLAYVHSNI
jgi:hypothetical protein